MSDRITEVTDSVIGAAVEANKASGNVITDKGKHYLSTKEGAKTLNKYLQVGDQKEQIDELQKENKELGDLAIRDGLTGLYNRRYFDKKLSEMPLGAPVTILMLDIDNFKSVNDKHTHAAGDEMLISLSRIVVDNVPIVTGDVVARYGGEEIVVLMPGLDNIELAKERAETIRKAVENSRIEHEGVEIRRTVSIGIDTRKGSDTPLNTLHNADKALYLAKNTGKNKVEAYKNSNV